MESNLQDNFEELTAKGAQATPDVDRSRLARFVLHLLVSVVQNVSEKVSERAKRALRSVLPVAIPTELVGFYVDGVLMLAFLWMLKAYLEVICTLGSLVFVSILLIHGIWIGVAYVQENRNHKGGIFEDEGGRSKRARRDVRSVLPVAIPSKLVNIQLDVGFYVDGVLKLVFLWMLKAYLEVICTLGSLVFVSILLIHGIWIGVAYVQENCNHKGGNVEDEGRR